MPESIRSFLAFDIENEDVQKRLASAQSSLNLTGADLKLVEPQNIHITVRFLSDISADMVEQVFREMQKVQFSPFFAEINGLGAFPDLRYPRVLWAGITKGADQLESIFNKLEPLLRGLGFAPDSKGFSPHLTIARVRSAKNKAH